LAFIFGPGVFVAIAGLTALLVDDPETADTEALSPVAVVIGTLVQNLWFLGVALLLARRVARPRFWHFGFARTALWPAVGWSALGLVSYYLLSATYSAIVRPDGEQDTLEVLGADQSTVALLVAGLMVIVVAPVFEEAFFRGFFYRALRGRLSIWWAAGINGALFGTIHFAFDGWDNLVFLAPLAILGVIFCLVYERTGSLYAPIAMHAFNNALAFSVGVDDGWIVALIAGPGMLLACVGVPRILSPPARPVAA